jgi:hypothetical protein
MQSKYDQYREARKKRLKKTYDSVWLKTPQLTCSAIYIYISEADMKLDVSSQDDGLKNRDQIDD